MTAVELCVGARRRSLKRVLGNHRCILAGLARILIVCRKVGRSGDEYFHVVCIRDIDGTVAVPNRAIGGTHPQPHFKQHTASADLLIVEDLFSERFSRPVCLEELRIFPLPAPFFDVFKSAPEGEAGRASSEHQIPVLYIHGSALMGGGDCDLEARTGIPLGGYSIHDAIVRIAGKHIPPQL